MEKDYHTPQACEIGDELRQLRERSGVGNGAQFAVHLGWDASKISNVERGKVRATSMDLAQYLTACGKNRDAILEFESRYRHVFEPYFAQRADNLTTVTYVERWATSITGYGASVIPDLLQTPAYAQQVLRWSGATEEQVRQALRSQRERQTVLRRPGRPDCLFYVAESAIQRQVVQGEAAATQLDRLKAVRGIVRVVPVADEVLLSAGFTVYEAETKPAAVFSDCGVAQVITVADEAVTRCRAVLGLLNEVALSEAESWELLSRWAGEKYVSVLLDATGERPAAAS